MSKTLLKNNIFLALAGGFSLVLAFPPIEVVPLAFFMPFFLNLLILKLRTFKQGFWMGFVCSLAIMLGAFYWVVYVIHIFGHLPWIVAALLFCGFCGFGALNFPLFLGLGVALQNRIRLERKPTRVVALWFALGLPALFTLVEFSIPKLFPWFICHALYQTSWTNQIVELTGGTFLSFCIYSLGSSAGLFFMAKSYPKISQARNKALSASLVLWVICIGFSLYRLSSPFTPVSQTRSFNALLVQANIGSLEKANARKGAMSIVRYVQSKYRELTGQYLSLEEKPDLIVWPETAMPFYLVGKGSYARTIREAVKKWQVPLITGGYAPYRDAIFRDYNAAYLLDPIANALEVPAIYQKNILLAYGEYMPLGTTLPILYKWFPQVANFKRGTRQNIFTLHDGMRIGVSICYEAIVPSFYRKIAGQGVNAIVNLTNDSWFGPTSEPYQHAALSVFRAIETRVPLLRVTNTGLTFSVDAMGRRSESLGVYTEGALSTTVSVPTQIKLTTYLKYGDWFVVVCALILLALMKELYAPLFVRSRHRRPTP